MSPAFIPDEAATAYATAGISVLAKRYGVGYGTMQTWLRARGVLRPHGVHVGHTEPLSHLARRRAQIRCYTARPEVRLRRKIQRVLRSVEKAAPPTNGTLLLVGGNTAKPAPVSTP